MSGKGEVKIEDMPLHKIMNRNQVSGKELGWLLKEYIRLNKGLPKFAAIEDVHSMPDQGIASTFRFGYSAGIIMGVLQALEIPVLRVKPSVWKASLNLSADKSRSLSLAKKLYPRYADLFKRKKDDGRAEALLIAHFAKQTFG